MPRQINTLIAAPWGPMIVSRLDRVEGPGCGYGVGYDLLERGDYDPELRNAVIALLEGLRKTNGDGVAVFDVGANIGAFSVPWGLAMTGWGELVAFEPQYYVYQLLCGNLALNNVRNVACDQVAVGAKSGIAKVPFMNPALSGSFGSLSLLSDTPQDTGQEVSLARYAECKMVTVDEYVSAFKRIDLLKIDAEGMEPDVLAGAVETLRTHHPVVIAEVTKCGTEEVVSPLQDAGYRNIRQLDRLNIIATYHE